MLTSDSCMSDDSGYSALSDDLVTWASGHMTDTKSDQRHRVPVHVSDDWSVDGWMTSDDALLASDDVMTSGRGEELIGLGADCCLFQGISELSPHVALPLDKVDDVCEAARACSPLPRPLTRHHFAAALGLQPSARDAQCDTPRKRVRLDCSLAARNDAVTFACHSTPRSLLATVSSAAPVSRPLFPLTEAAGGRCRLSSLSSQKYSRIGSMLELVDLCSPLGVRVRGITPYTMHVRRTSHSIDDDCATCEGVPTLPAHASSEFSEKLRGRSPCELFPISFTVNKRNRKLAPIRVYRFSRRRNAQRKRARAERKRRGTSDAGGCCTERCASALGSHSSVDVSEVPTDALLPYDSHAQCDATYLPSEHADLQSHEPAPSCGDTLLQQGENGRKFGKISQEAICCDKQAGDTNFHVTYANVQPRDSDLDIRDNEPQAVDTDLQSSSCRTPSLKCDMPGEDANLQDGDFHIHIGDVKIKSELDSAPAGDVTQECGGPIHTYCGVVVKIEKADPGDSLEDSASDNIRISSCYSLNETMLDSTDISQTGVIVKSEDSTIAALSDSQSESQRIRTSYNLCDGMPNTSCDIPRAIQSESPHNTLCDSPREMSQISPYERMLTSSSCDPRDSVFDRPCDNSSEIQCDTAHGVSCDNLRKHISDSPVKNLPVNPPDTQCDNVIEGVLDTCDSTSKSPHESLHDSPHASPCAIPRTSPCASPADNRHVILSDSPCASPCVTTCAGPWDSPSDNRHVILCDKSYASPCAIARAGQCTSPGDNRHVILRSSPHDNTRGVPYDSPCASPYHSPHARAQVSPRISPHGSPRVSSRNNSCASECKNNSDSHQGIPCDKPCDNPNTSPCDSVLNSPPESPHDSVLDCTFQTRSPSGSLHDSILDSPPALLIDSPLLMHDNTCNSPNGSPQSSRQESTRSGEYDSVSSNSEVTSVLHKPSLHSHGGDTTSLANTKVTQEFAPQIARSPSNELQQPVMSPADPKNILESHLFHLSTWEKLPDYYSAVLPKPNYYSNPLPKPNYYNTSPSKIRSSLPANPSPSSTAVQQSAQASASSSDSRHLKTPAIIVQSNVDEQIHPTSSAHTSSPNSSSSPLCQLSEQLISTSTPDNNCQTTTSTSPCEPASSPGRPSMSPQAPSSAPSPPPHASHDTSIAAQSAVDISRDATVVSPVSPALEPTIPVSVAAHETRDKADEPIYQPDVICISDDDDDDEVDVVNSSSRPPPNLAFTQSSLNEPRDLNDLDEVTKSGRMSVMFKCHLCGTEIMFTQSTTRYIIEHFAKEHGVGNLQVVRTLNQNGEMCFSLVALTPVSRAEVCQPSRTVEDDQARTDMGDQPLDLRTKATREARSSPAPVVSPSARSSASDRPVHYPAYPTHRNMEGLPPPPRGARVLMNYLTRHPPPHPAHRPHAPHPALLPKTPPPLIPVDKALAMLRLQQQHHTMVAPPGHIPLHPPSLMPASAAQLMYSQRHVAASYPASTQRPHRATHSYPPHPTATTPNGLLQKSNYVSSDDVICLD